MRDSGDSRSLYPPVVMDRRAYGSTANTMNTCTIASATSASMVAKCHQRAHAYPPNRSVSRPSDTGFQMERPVSTITAPRIGMLK
ncbi:MAG TPA: hypothetical protein VFT45_24255 [Longimicrobium sp.]|nr:hypothetical protein [Longimicrobium sp.]